MSCDYNYFKDVKNCLLYLDPPYKGTSNYAKSCMNYDHFYKFCHDIAQNNFVIISEYDMPSEEFKCIWQKNAQCVKMLIVQTGKRQLKNYLFQIYD